jgi:16S rRNA (guanine527-N7)-methyltransferase
VPDSIPGAPDPATVLAEGAAELGLSLDAAQLGRLVRLATLLLDWNARFNLTAIRDPLEVVAKHLLDSLAVLPLLRGRRIADVGSGAGFPGLPLAIADPARDYTLIEATAKKARFIAEAIAVLEVGNAQVVNARAEQWKPAEPFDAVLTRAVGSLAEIVRVAGRLCGPRGALMAMKGRFPADEIAALPETWRVESAPRIVVPGVAAERHLVVLTRASGGGRSL